MMDLANNHGFQGFVSSGSLSSNDIDQSWAALVERGEEAQSQSW